MPTPELQRELERIGAERLAAERLATRDNWRSILWALLGCVASCLGGMVVLGFAFWVTDLQLAWVFFWSGLLLGYSGMAWSLLSVYKKIENRGGW